MTESSPFKDHFSTQSDAYSQYRPDYPETLFALLAANTPAHELAWDCATGNGQAAVELTQYFSQVVATDASQRQIDKAMIYPRIEYRVAPAEKAPLADHSVDLITVAQALHWFDFDGFFNEVKRVLKADGILAVWLYGLHRINAAIDAVVDRYYHDITGPYWPPERAHIENGYADIEFPFQEARVPAFEMRKQWSLDHLLGYLGTWSATQRCLADTGEDPREQIVEDLKAAWGDASQTRTVHWPITLRVFRP